MFQKPVKVKSQTVLKSSERKKFRVELETQYPRLPPGQSLLLIPNKGHVTVARVHLHSGSEVAVYACENEPLVFVANNVIYPTVYALWKYPDMVSSVATWSHVCGRIRDGADLMLPGVIIANGCMSHADIGALDRGTVCAVHCAGIRSAIAVGEAAMSGTDMLASGMRGKGFLIRHCYGDHLWSLGSKSMPPATSCPACLSSGQPQAASGEAADSSTDEGRASSLDDRPVSAADSADEGTQSAVVTVVTGNDCSTSNADNSCRVDLDMRLMGLSDASGEAGAAAVMGSCETRDSCCAVDPGTSADSGIMAGHGASCSVDEAETSAGAAAALEDSPDSLLYKCFLCALKTSLSKSDLPILTSNFYRNHLLPCCPAGEVVDLKKTQYKKLSVFLKAMQAKGLIAVEEQSVGVEAIVKFDKSHPELRSFKAWRAVTELGEDCGAASGQPSDGEFVPPTITEMLCVTQAMVPLLRPAGYSKGDSITMQEVRRVLTEYIKSNALQCPDDKRSVMLNGLLCDCLLTKADGYVERLRWTDIFERCANKLQETHMISYATGQTVTKKGAVKPLVVRVETRSGNKQVTLLENFEQFGIDAKQLAKDVRLGVACSTSVTSLPGKQSQPGQQVLAQGDQSSFVARLLQEKYKVLPKYLDLPK